MITHDCCIVLLSSQRTYCLCESERRWRRPIISITLKSIDNYSAEALEFGDAEAVSKD